MIPDKAAQALAEGVATAATNSLTVAFAELEVVLSPILIPLTAIVVLALPKLISRIETVDREISLYKQSAAATRAVSK